MLSGQLSQCFNAEAAEAEKVEPSQLDTVLPEFGTVSQRRPDPE